MARRRFDGLGLAVVFCALGAAVGGDGAADAAPVNVVHPPVPVIVPHPAPPPVHIVVPPAPPPHIVLPPAPPPPVPHVVLPPAPPPPVVQAPVVPPAVPAPALAAAVPPPADSAINDPTITQQTTIRDLGRHPGRSLTRPLPARSTALRPARAHARSKPAVLPAPAHSAGHVTPAARTAAAEPATRLPLPPPAQPEAPAATADTSPGISTAPASPNTAAIDPPSLAQTADPPAPIGTRLPAVTAAVTDRGSRLAAGLPPQPSGRLLQSALLDALTATLGFAPRPGVMPVAPPGPALAPDSAPITGIGVPLPSAARPQFRASAPVAAPAVGRANALRRMFDSPMEFLREHLIPVAPSPFGQPRPFDLRAQHAWPFAQTLSQELAAGLQDNSVGIAAVVVAALVAMTALTAAGAGLGGRPLRHTAWRAGRRRLRAVSEWPTVLDPIGDATGQPAPEPQVAAWPDRAPAAEPLAASRERRVA